MSFAFELVAASTVPRISASDCGRAYAFKSPLQKSRPISPANRPVNALTRDWGGLPWLDIVARNPRSKTLRFVARENLAEIHG